MEHLNKKEEICRKVAESFRFAGKITEMSPYGSGHINDTFMLTCELEDGSNKHYILQRMNDDIFRNPKELMENVVNVTTFLRKKIIAAGGDPERETLNIILTRMARAIYRMKQVIIGEAMYSLMMRPALIW